VHGVRAGGVLSLLQWQRGRHGTRLALELASAAMQINIISAAKGSAAPLVLGIIFICFIDNIWLGVTSACMARGVCQVRKHVCLCRAAA
jgi:hypothetical protein